VRHSLRAMRLAQDHADQPQSDAARHSPRLRIFRSNPLPGRHRSSHAARLEVRVVRATFLLSRCLAATTGTASSFADAAHSSPIINRLPRATRRR